MAAGPASRLGSTEPGDKTGPRPSPALALAHPYRGPGAAGPVTGGARGFCGGPADPSHPYATTGNSSEGKGLT